MSGDDQGQNKPGLQDTNNNHVLQSTYLSWLTPV